MGLPLTADGNRIRKKFLQLAKLLHPDIPGRTAAEKELATQYFAKLVSPAYKLLGSDRDRNEYFATLRLLVQRLKQKGEPIEVEAEAAKKLLRLSHETNYLRAVDEVASRQYESLDAILDVAAELSELNLVYLMTQESVVPPTVRPAVAATATPAATTPKVSPAQRNLQLAELFVSKKQWREAQQELKAAEKLDPNNAQVHALLGLVYLQQNVASLAKTSLQKALKLDPQEPTALKCMKQLNAAASTAAKPVDKKGGGGLFGGLFGGKK